MCLPGSDSHDSSKTASIPAAKRSLTGQQPASGQGIFIGQKASGQNTVGQNASAASSSGGAAAPVTPEKLDWKQQKEEQARLRKRQNDLKKVEESIQNLESRDQEIDTLLCDATVFSDVSRLMQLQKEKEEIAKELESLYEKWEELAE